VHPGEREGDPPLGAIGGSGAPFCSDEKSIAAEESVIVGKPKGMTAGYSNGRQVATEAVVGSLTDIERRHAAPVLYLSGTYRIPLVHPRVAIVGTRQPSDAGRARAAEIAESLAERGVTTVSGLARGVDTIVHRTTLATEGSTIAVIGTPLTRCYPAENAELQHLLMRSHLVVSEFAEGSAVHPSNFVQRNRTMALLADASVIVESGDTGGSLSQGWETLRLGRPLFIHDEEYKKAAVSWPAKMARYGAVRFRDPEDIFESLPTPSPGPELAILAPQTA
jgi:DNA processing protein